jgi:hypothetical protein
MFNLFLQGLQYHLWWQEYWHYFVRDHAGESESKVAADGQTEQTDFLSSATLGGVFGCPY